MKRHKDFWSQWLVFWVSTIVIIAFFGAMFYVLCENPECNHRFLMTKITTQIFLVATVITYIIFHFIDYSVMNKPDDNTVKMKFNCFKDVYCVNSGRWSIYNDRLQYRYEDGWQIMRYYVIFSYLDWLKFLLWKKVYEDYKRVEHKRKKEKEHDERMAQMLKCIQKDINNVYEKII